MRAKAKNKQQRKQKLLQEHGTTNHDVVQRFHQHRMKHHIASMHAKGQALCSAGLITLNRNMLWMSKHVRVDADYNNLFQ